ncbi:BMP family ABC transporter substrate-binding protein [Collimonas sp.]|jgi:basic membrane protein A|uniref:BMP family ABC transporter substrate-binding protein n=1 Tax=Collimonas sp. TaxID=1963772 RepID=UPI002C0D432D|nr:BMP family ABC transporter substrate-binding protein [Collimonas sp.]HWW06539.1 BMP family ABC transporter substrate-binding protein [Collimonas sp.]
MLPIPRTSCVDADPAITEAECNRPHTRWWLLLLPLALLLASVSAITSAADLPKIIYVRPVPNNDDVLLQQGTSGINNAAKLYRLQASTLESQASRAGRQQQLDNAVRQDARIVVVIGIEFKEILDQVARQAPQTRFVILEHCIANAAANITCITFRENEASYLAGMQAALASSTGKIGMIGAINTTLRQKNSQAFAAGARAAKPGISIHEPLWVEGPQPFNDPPRAETLTKTMLGDGVDVIWAAAAGSNTGVFKVLTPQSRAKAIGSGVNQCIQAPGRVLDNVEVHADTAIALAVGLLINGSTAPRFDFGLKEGAVTLTALGLDAAYSECEILHQRPLLLKLREANNAIVSGKLNID